MESDKSKTAAFEGIGNPACLIPIIGCGCALLLLYFNVFQGLIEDWWNLPDFSHGFLIPILSAYFIYGKRKDLASLPISGIWGGLIIILSAVGLFLFGNIAGEYFSMRISFIFLLLGGILFVLGKGYFKKLWFPILFLIFMIPIPSVLLDRITFPMQLFASKVATGVLQVLAIPVLREGNIIYLANTSLEVAEACSGIRSLNSLLALSVVFAYFTQKITWKRIALVLGAFPIAILANAVRVSGTGVLAYFWGDEVAQGFFHGVSGWILFLIAFVFLLGLGSLISKVK